MVREGSYNLLALHADMAWPTMQRRIVSHHAPAIFWERTNADCSSDLLPPDRLIVSRCRMLSATSKVRLAVSGLGRRRRCRA